MSEFEKMKGYMMDILTYVSKYWYCLHKGNCPNNISCDECNKAELDKFIELCKKEG